MNWKPILAAALLGSTTTAPALAGRLADVTVYDSGAGRVLPVHAHDGRSYVVGQPGNEYQIRIQNRTGAEILAVVSVDGVNAVSGETAGWNQTGYVLDLKSFKLWRRFSYPGEGWGITHNDRELIMSDGTPELRFLDPLTFKELRRLRVTANGQPLSEINELEWVEGEIYANIWRTDRIARIDPGTGRVVGWIDLTGLLPQRGGGEDVLNGIAYDRQKKRLFVTGKLWPRLFEIQLVKR